VTKAPRIRELVPPIESARLADAVSTTGLTLVGKSAGFLVPLAIAAWFGVSGGTDAFFFAYSAILFLAGIFGPVLEVVVPFVAEARGQHESLGRFMSGLLTTGTFVVLLALGGLLLALAAVLPLITRFDHAGVHLVVGLAMEISPLAVLLWWTSLLSGYLNAHKAFVVPAVAPAARAAVNIAAVFLLKGSIGVHALPLGYVAGEAARLAVLGLAIRRRAPFRFRPVLRVSHRIVAFYRASAYPIAGMLWLLMNPLVDSAMASWLAPGSVSVLRYAETFYMIPFSLFTGGLVTVLLAHWSEKHLAAVQGELERDVARSTRQVLWITVPATVFLIAASRPMTGLLLGHGSFDPARVGDVATAWACYLVGFPAHAAAQLKVKALLVLKKTRVLLSCALVAVVLNVLLNLALMNVLGVAGITLATAATSGASAIYLARGLRAAFAESSVACGVDRAAAAE
jgi:putative peptidoglycan lipid II flippase